MFAVRVKAHIRKIKRAGKDGKVKVIKQQVAAHTRRQALPWGDIPARTYMMLQEQDWPKILTAASSYLTGLK